jgi:MFS family permease
VALVLVLATHESAVWPIYLAVAAGSLVGAFRWPAYMAATSLLAPRQHLGRATGMIQLGEALAQVLSPVLAGSLLLAIGVRGILLVDFATFLVALATLLTVKFPAPPMTGDAASEGGRLLHAAARAWAYIAARRGLLGLLVFMAVSNFLAGFVGVLATPLVLSFTSPRVLGVLLSAGACGMVIGGLAMSLWGGPSRRVHGVLGFMLLNGLCVVSAGFLRSPVPFAVAAFVFFLTIPVINGSNQAIWQSKVVPELQGRVLAAGRTLALSSLPVAYLVAGPLADKVFEPLLASEGRLAGSLGPLLGTGPGRGIALMFVLMGLLTMAGSAAAFLFSPLRRVESELPDWRAPVSTGSVGNSR